MNARTLTGLFALTLAVACSSESPAPPKTDAQYKADVTTAMQKTLGTSLTDFRKAVAELQAAAPTPQGRGWDKAQDAQAIASMRASWTKARASYELIEGAIAPIFPDLDLAVDERYDGFLADLAGKGDPDPFDDVGTTGMHAVERILYSDVIPQSVVDFEKTLPGYAPAAFPATEQEARAFKDKLCAKLVADVAKMETQWQPAQIDLGAAFQGLIGLMNEQKEKVNKASLGKEESRYAQTTLLDLRKNLDGTRQAYLLFQPWVLAKTSGAGVDKAVLDGMTRLFQLYMATPGDAIPAPPATWSSDAPTPADLQTPFGKLWSGVQAEVDTTRPESVVNQMNAAADLLGYPQFKQK